MSHKINKVHPAFQDKPINYVLLNWQIMPDDGQIRLPVVKQLLGVSSATIWRLVKKGHLKTYKLTERTTTFNIREIKQFLASKGVA